MLFHQRRQRQIASIHTSSPSSWPCPMMCSTASRSMQQRPAKDHAIAIAIIVQSSLVPRPSIDWRPGNETSAKRCGQRVSEHGTRNQEPERGTYEKWLWLAADGAGLVYVWGAGGETPTALLSASSCKGGGIQLPPSSMMTLGSQRERDWEGTLYVSAVLQGSGVILQQQVICKIYFMFCVCSSLISRHWQEVVTFAWSAINLRFFFSTETLRFWHNSDLL